jgi:hypothetical protein
VLWVRSGVVGDVPECSGITYRLVHTSRADSDVRESQSDCFFYGCASLQRGTRRSRDHQNRDSMEDGNVSQATESDIFAVLCMGSIVGMGWPCRRKSM